MKVTGSGPPSRRCCSYDECRGVLSVCPLFDGPGGWIRKFRVKRRLILFQLISTVSDAFLLPPVRLALVFKYRLFPA